QNNNNVNNNIMNKHEAITNNKTHVNKQKRRSSLSALFNFGNSNKLNTNSNNNVHIRHKSSFLSTISSLRGKKFDPNITNTKNNLTTVVNNNTAYTHNNTIHRKNSTLKTLFFGNKNKNMNINKNSTS